MDFNIGVDYITKNKYSEAEKSLQKALNYNKENGLIYYYLGICYYRNENYPQAQANFSQAIDKQIKIEDSYLKKGLIFFKFGDFLEAENCLNNSIKSNDNNWYSRYLLGQIKLKSKEYEKAADHFRRAMTLCQDTSLIEAQKGYIYSMIKLNKKEEAFSFFHEHLSKYTDRPEVFQLHARIHKEIGDCSQALILIDKALEMKPLDVIMIGDRVTYNYYCQNYYECIKEGEELLKLQKLGSSSKYSSLLFYIGSSYLKLNNTDKGKKYLRDYEKLTNNDSYSRLIEYYIDQASLEYDTTRDCEACMKYVNKALEMNSEYFPALYMKNELELLSDNPDYSKYLNEQQRLIKKRNEGVKLPQIIPEVNLVINTLKDVNHY